MNQIGKTLLLCAAFGLSFNLQALTPDSRYNTIVDRNIFRLNPMPPPPTPTNDTAVMDRKVEFSGISNVGGQKKAWFVVPPKAGAGAKELPLYLNLAEGEAGDFLEVISISEEEGEVKILNSKNPMVLSLKNNSLKPSNVAPIPSPGQPVAGVPASAPGLPTGTPSYGINGSAASTGNSGRSVTVSGGTPTLPSLPGTVTDAGGMRSIPTRTLRLATPPPGQPEKPMDPAEQAAHMIIQQEVAKQRGQQLPPLPFPVPE